MNANSISTSPSLIQRVKEQDGRAWNRFVQLYTPLIYHWARRVSLQHSDAIDIVQDVFLAISRSVEKYDSDKGSGFRGWLWGITQNKLAQFRRVRSSTPYAAGGSAHQFRFAETPDQPPSKPREELCILAQRAASLIRSDFAAKTFDAFWKVTVENQEPKRVAEEMGMSLPAVYKAKSRVLAHLRTELDFPDVL